MVYNNAWQELIFRYNRCIQSSHQYNDSADAYLLLAYPNRKRRKQNFSWLKFEKSNRRSVHTTHALHGLDKAREMHTTSHRTHIAELFVDILWHVEPVAHTNNSYTDLEVDTNSIHTHIRSVGRSVARSLAHTYTTHSHTHRERQTSQTEKQHTQLTSLYLKFSNTQRINFNRSQ